MHSLATVLEVCPTTSTVSGLASSLVKRSFVCSRDAASSIKAYVTVESPVSTGTEGTPSRPNARRIAAYCLPGGRTTRTRCGGRDVLVDATTVVNRYVAK